MGHEIATVKNLIMNYNIVDTLPVAQPSASETLPSPWPSHCLYQLCLQPK